MNFQNKHYVYSKNKLIAIARLECSLYNRSELNTAFNNRKLRTGEQLKSETSLK